MQPALLRQTSEVFAGRNLVVVLNGHSFFDDVESPGVAKALTGTRLIQAVDANGSVYAAYTCSRNSEGSAEEGVTEAIKRPKEHSKSEVRFQRMCGRRARG